MSLRWFVFKALDTTAYPFVAVSAGDVKGSSRSAAHPLLKFNNTLKITL